METRAQTAPKERLLSLDVMRGLVMIPIIGFSHLCTKLFLYSQDKDWKEFWHMMHRQMHHPYWHGLTFFDIILPLFIFTAGMSLGVANKSLVGVSWKERLPSYRKAILRLFILIILGIIYNHASESYWPDSFDKVRCASVLGMIGISWFIAAMVSWHGSNRSVFAAIAAIAAFIPILRWTVNVPGFGPGHFTSEGSLNAYIDSVLLPGATYANQAHDPEGIIPLIASVIVSLCGVLAGKLVISKTAKPALQVSALVATGSFLIISGWLLDVVYPINKNLWTMSFVCVATGWCAVIAAVCHLLFDIFKLRWLAFPMAVVGMNSILIYMGNAIIVWPHAANVLLGWSLPAFTDRFQPVAMSFYILALQILFAVWLYKRRIFIRV